jgi:hypothetical protein
VRNQQHAASVFSSDGQAHLEPKEDSMTDPRYTDPRYSDPRSDTGLPQGDSIGGPWGWIVGIAAVVLIVFLVFAGIHQGKITASNNNPSVTTGSTPSGGMKPPSTTGFGGSSPQPTSPPMRSGQ